MFSGICLSVMHVEVCGLSRNFCLNITLIIGHSVFKPYMKGVESECYENIFREEATWET